MSSWVRVILKRSLLPPRPVLYLNHVGPLLRLVVSLISCRSFTLIHPSPPPTTDHRFYANVCSLNESFIRLTLLNLPICAHSQDIQRTVCVSCFSPIIINILTIILIGPFSRTLLCGHFVNPFINILNYNQTRKYLKIIIFRRVLCFTKCRPTDIQTL